VGALAVQNADMRPEELVGGAGKKIAVQRGDIDRAVRHVLNRIHKDKGARVVGKPGQQGDIGDRADRVGRMGDRDQTRFAGTQRRLEAFEIECRVGGVNIDRPDDRPLSREIGPWRHVGIVVQIGDHDLIAGTKCLPERAGKMKRQGGHAGAKEDCRRVVGNADQVRDRLPGIGDNGIRALTGAKRPADIGIAVRVVAGHRIDHTLRHLCPAGVVEEDRSWLQAKGRELRTQGSQFHQSRVESSHHLRYNLTMFILVPSSLHDELIPLVAARVPQAVLTPYDEDPALSPTHADEAEVVLRWVAGKRYGGLVASGPRVRWLHTASAGVDHVLTPEVKAKPGLILTDSGPAFAIAMSEFVLTWMLMVAHRMPEILAQQQSRTWKWITQEELHSQTVGIIGLGPIGQGIAARCKAVRDADNRPAPPQRTRPERR
jgi:hypothetical protein